MKREATNGERSREEILALIRQHQGLHKSELARLTGKGWGNTGHHLSVMKRKGSIDLEVHGRLLWAFDKHVPLEERKLIVAKRHAPARRLLEILGLRERSTVGTLSEELAVSKKVIRTHLGALTRAGVIEKLPGRPPEFTTSATRSPRQHEKP